MVVSKCDGMLSLEFCKTECFIYYAIEKGLIYGNAQIKKKCPSND